MGNLVGSSLVVASAGGGLVSAAPSWPMQVVLGRLGRAAERWVHAADLVDGQAGHRLSVASGDQAVTAAWRAGKLPTGRWPPYLRPAAVTRPVAGRRPGRAGGGDREPCLVASARVTCRYPGDVLPDLIMVERGLVLGGLEAFLDRHLAPATLTSSESVALRGDQHTYKASSPEAGERRISRCRPCPAGEIAHSCSRSPFDPGPHAAAASPGPAPSRRAGRRGSSSWPRPGPSCRRPPRSRRRSCSPPAITAASRYPRRPRPSSTSLSAIEPCTAATRA